MEIATEKKIHYTEQKGDLTKELLTMVIFYLK